MEGSFSVATNNRFAFFMNDEDDPGDVILEESKFATKSNKSKEASSTQQPPKEEKSPQGKKKDASKEKGQTQTGKKAENNGKKKEQMPEKTQIKDNKGVTNSGGEKPRGFNKRPQSSSNGTTNAFSNERGERTNENRPPRQQQFRSNRGRLPSKENQEGNTNATEDTYKNGDSRARPRWNRDRFDRGGGERQQGVGNDRGGDGERGFRPFRGNRGGFRGGKREFERRSGSDKSSVKPVDKRDGGGAHNWGTMKDDIDSTEWLDESEANVEQEVKDSEEKTEEGQQQEQVQEETVTDKKDEEGAEADKPKEEGEEEDTTPQLTLDEYKALQEKKRSVPLFKERRAGENEDQTRWKNMIVYERAEDEFFPGTREIVEKYKTSGREKTTIESNFFFRDERRFGRGGGRGGGGFGNRRDDRKESSGGEKRGGNNSSSSGGSSEKRDDNRRNDGGGRRGGRGGGGDRRPPRNRDRSQFNVEDEKDFPSLTTVSA